MLVGVDAARLRFTSVAGRVFEHCPELEHASRFRLLHQVGGLDDEQLDVLAADNAT